MTRTVRRLLQLPLETKLLVPNVIVIGIALAGFAGGMPGAMLLTVAAALNFALVRLALKPVNQMQHIAEQVAKGDLSARVLPSPIADAGLTHLAVTFNEALDYLAEARESVRESGARIVYAQERERASVARELHDSIGQTLAAASYHAAAAANAAAGLPTEEKNALEVARLLRWAMDDLRTVSRELHPRVADDLGLPAALDALTRSTMERSLIDVQLSVKGFNQTVSPAASSMFYRIAQEVLRNIEGSASRGTVVVAITSDNGEILMEIDEACVFDGTDGHAVQSSLAVAAERLSLLGGELLIESTFLGGTKVIARLKGQQEAA